MPLVEPAAASEWQDPHVSRKRTAAASRGCAGAVVVAAGPEGVGSLDDTSGVLVPDLIPSPMPTPTARATARIGIPHVRTRRHRRPAACGASPDGRAAGRPAFGLGPRERRGFRGARTMAGTVLRGPYGMAVRPVGPPGRSARIARVIDLDTVRHVARLARLRLQPDEETRMQQELNGILEHVDRIQSLDLDDVEPTSHVIDVRNVLRDDVPRPSLTREDALENAPEVMDGGFAVPKIG